MHHILLRVFMYTHVFMCKLCLLVRHATYFIISILAIQLVLRLCTQCLYIRYWLKTTLQLSLHFTGIALKCALALSLKVHSTQVSNLIAACNLICLVHDKIPCSDRSFFAIVTCGITFFGDYFYEIMI